MMNATTVTVAPVLGMEWTTTTRVFTPLAALPVLLVWFIVWRVSPKRNLHINNPYTKMQYLYALMTGSMAGFLAGHALPNALLIGEYGGVWKCICFFVGMCATAAFIRFARTCGPSLHQVAGDTSDEPYMLFDADGEQMDRVSTTPRRTPVGSVNVQPPSSAMDAFVGTSYEDDYDSGTVTPNAHVIISQSTGDNMATDIADSGDAWDVLWIRRKTAWLIMTIYLFYSSCDGLFLMYNFHEVRPAVLVACFWIFKCSTAATLSGFFVYGYVQLHPSRGLLCCCRRTRCVYPMAALLSSITVVLSSIPVVMGVGQAYVDMVVENAIFGCAGALVAGILLTFALRFVFFEARETSNRAEFKWWVLFALSGLGTACLGLFL